MPESSENKLPREEKLRNRGLTPPARLMGTALRPIVDRNWFLTWTTYGTWLPGDDRGFVSNIDRGDGKGYRLNELNTLPAAKMRGLALMANQKMLGPPVYLSQDLADLLLGQFHETANHRGWQLQVVGIMRNHVHVVLGVPGDPDPENLLRDLKSYGSRKLNRCTTRPQSGTWWTESGSKRKLTDETSIREAVLYVRDQPWPLTVWLSPWWHAEFNETNS